ncbi:MAG: hypothetical protein RBT49_02575 [Bacteroidales bacterium]|jgi:hypothetical protein|nr:hypothetical protein [Bacteroidales bacterium]
MKTRLVWKESWINENKDSFWIECTDQEVIDNILPLKCDSNFLKEIEQNKGSSKINKNKNDIKYCNFFLISVDLKDIQSYKWHYPFSGMWNAINPFEEIDEFDFSNLEQLSEFNIKSLKRKN